MNVIAELVNVSELTPPQRNEMFRLMDRYYIGMARDVFESDLDEKRWVLQIVESDTRILRGFSTQMLLKIELAGRPIRALFSGDTIMDHRFWGHNPLAQAWGRLALTLIDQCLATGHELYWYLIVKGYKTYRFLPVFFQEFYPRYHARTPDWAAAMLDKLGREKFSRHYDAQSGIIRAPRRRTPPPRRCRHHAGAPSRSACPVF